MFVVEAATNSSSDSAPECKLDHYCRFAQISGFFFTLSLVSSNIITKFSTYRIFDSDSEQW